MLYFSKSIGRNIAVLCLITLSNLMFIRGAHAVDWEHIIDTQDGKVYVDLDSYDDDDMYSRITTRTSYKSPQSASAHDDKSSNKSMSKKSYSSKMVTAQFDCKQHTISILSVVLMDKQGKFVARETPAAHSSPVTDKTDQGVETLVCQVRKMVKG